VPLEVTVRRCNCSICTKSGFLHLILAAVDFELIDGADDLTEYRFNTGVARHLFCKQCGIKLFYVPRSHPQGFSVNARCLDIGDTVRIKVKNFDGQNWKRDIDNLINQGEG
jgi:hypothetical protein